MVKERDIYFCEKCGNLIEVLSPGAPALVCCGSSMKKLDEKTEDASTEKHVPYLVDEDGGVLVKIGQNAAHPMLENHYIKFIEIFTENETYRRELKPGDPPEAWFPVEKGDIIKVREWCNLHGLWKS